MSLSESVNANVTLLIEGMKNLSSLRCTWLLSHCLCPQSVDRHWHKIGGWGRGPASINAKSRDPGGNSYTEVSHDRCCVHFKLLYDARVPWEGLMLFADRKWDASLSGILIGTGKTFHFMEFRLQCWGCFLETFQTQSSSFRWAAKVNPPMTTLLSFVRLSKASPTWIWILCSTPASLKYGFPAACIHSLICRQS